MARALGSPTVSCIIPTYNRAHLLFPAIASIAAQTAMEHGMPATSNHDEIIIVDDGSTDNTEQAMRHFLAHQSGAIPVRYLMQPHRGPAAARNAGIRAAHGDLIAFCDSDDRWFPRKLADQLEVYQAHPDAGLVYAGRQIRDAQTSRITRRTIPESTYDVHALKARCPIAISTVIVPRHVFAVVGLFDESLMFAEDWDLWIRIAQQFAMIGTPSVLAEYLRNHGDNLVEHTPRLAQFLARLAVIHKHRAIHGDQCLECQRAEHAALAYSTDLLWREKPTPATLLRSIL